MKKLLTFAIMALFIAFTTPSLAQSDLGEVAKQGLGILKGLIKKATPATKQGLVFSQNIVSYNRNCGNNAVMQGQPICKALKPFTIGKRSALGTVFFYLQKAAGNSNSQAQEASALLQGLRKQLGMKSNIPSTPAYLLAGVWKQLPGCFPPNCRIMKTKPEKSGALLSAILKYFKKYGGTEVNSAVSALKVAGY